MKLSVDDPNGGSPVDLDASGKATITGVTVAPATVTVTSSKGGTLDVPVHLDVNGVATRLDADGVRGQGRPRRRRQDGEAVRHRLAGQHRELPLDRPVRGRPGHPRREHRHARSPARPALSDADTDTASVAASGAGEFGYQLTVTDDGGATKSDTMVLTVGAGGGGGGGGGGTVDLLTAGKDRFQASAQRLVIDGVAAVTSTHKIDIWFSPTIHPGTTPDAIANVDPVDGTWAFDSGRGGTPTIPACSCVSYISELGNPASTDIGGNAEVAAGDRRTRSGRTSPSTTPPSAAVAAAAVAAVAAAVPARASSLRRRPGGGCRRRLRPAIPRRRRRRPRRPCGPRPAAARSGDRDGAAAGTTGLPVTVAVPAGAKLVRLRLLTTANKALFSTFKKVKGGTKIKVKIRSAKLRKQLRSASATSSRSGPARPATTSAGRRARWSASAASARGHPRSIGTPSPAECRGGRPSLQPDGAISAHVA